MPLSRLAMTEAASWYVVLGCVTTSGWVPGATGGCAPGVADAAGSGVGAAVWVGAGMILSVSRRISFTFCTSDSQRLFCAATSIVEVAPVAFEPAVAAAPNCVEAVDCIFTLREALR